MREKVYINDKICWFIDIVFPQDWTNDRPKLVCPICNEEFETGDKMYMVVNNGRLFPNCFIHESCSMHTFENTAINIMGMYTNYKECVERYRAWF